MLCSCQIMLKSLYVRVVIVLYLKEKRLLIERAWEKAKE